MSTLLRSRRVALATAPLLLLLAACGADDPAPVAADDRAPVAAPAADEAGAGGAAAGMCPVGTTDCVDADLGDGGDPIIAPDIHQVDALPADIRMVEMAPGTADAPMSLFIQEAVVDGARLDLIFSGGEAPCFFVDHVEVTETDTEVVVDLLAGGDPGADGCDAQEVSIQGVTVELDAPLGERALLDATRA